MRPEEPPNPREGTAHIRAAAGLGLVVGLVHALTTASGLFWLDAGDFATASCDLGVPHPTGYPLYVVIGKLFCLVPIGPAAFRVALSSAAQAGVLSGLLAWLALTIHPHGSWRARLAVVSVGVLALWTTRVAGLTGRTPEVYALHGALVMAALVAFVGLQRAGGPASWAGLGFVVGLGLSNHAEFRLFAPLFLGAAIWTGVRRGLRHATLVGRVALWLAAAVLGLLPYLYLPLAAARRPYHAWGDPETWSRFIDHVSGRAIQLGFPDQFLSLSGPRVSWAMGELTGQLVLDFGPLLLIAPLGLIALLRRHGGLGRLLVLLLVVDAAYAVLINPMGLTDRQNGLVTYCVVALTTAVGLGALIRQMMRRWSGSRGRQVAVGALLVTTTAICLLGADRRVLLQNGSWGAEDLVFEALQRAAEGALVLTSSDALAAARLYVVGLGALRPDLQALDRSELSDSRLLLERHRTGPFPLAPDHEAARWAQWGPGVTRDTYLQRIDALTEQALTAGREVLWEGGSATDSEGRWEGIIPTFPLHHIVPDTGLPAHLLPHAVQLVPDDPALERDPWGRRWLGHYLNYLGTYDVRRGRLDLAEEAFMLAHRTAPELAPPLVNLGVLAARAGDFAQASALAERATRLDPLDTRAWLNLARYRCALEHAPDAEYAARRATTLGAPIEGDWMCW